ncbi:hypothetical protein [Alicyclobacillus sp.]|uniref:hypothetical protein n=1 Tax=Alicyclobacillus sp. TaxID=61169 RepID=UPI0025C09BC4|nr:hypothetical protein [Alicyclobacillus sp.]MCL6516564.1 hypothetical protein [Alicyclobacillus sp.]
MEERMQTPPWVDGELEVLWDPWVRIPWTARPVALMPWWMRAGCAWGPSWKGRMYTGPDGAWVWDVDGAWWERGQAPWWAAAYPVLAPWHAFSVPDPAWWDPWALQSHHGYWA